MQYIAESHPPSSVTGAVKAPVLGDQDNLVLAKGSTLEVYNIEADLETPLSLVTTVKLNGSIIDVQALQPKDKDRACLIVLTSLNQLVAIAYDETSGSFVTEATKNLSERAARPSDYCQKIVIDPEQRLIGVNVYSGLFHIVPLPEPQRKKRASTKQSAEVDMSESILQKGFSRSFNLRLQHYNIRDVALVRSGKSVPMLAILHDDFTGAKSLKIRPINMAEREFADNPSSMQQYGLEDPGSELLVVVPDRGLVVVGEERAIFVQLGSNASLSLQAQSQSEDVKGKGKARTLSDASEKKVTPLKRRRASVTCSISIGVYTAATALDPSRFLLGDLHGNLHLLVVTESDQTVSSIAVKEAGHISSPTVLVTLSEDLVFVGSHYGDSQVIKLALPPVPRGPDDGDMALDTDEFVPSHQKNPSWVPTPESIQEVQTLTNLAPIVDFCIVQDSNQTRLVTCSGAHNDGSIRIVSHGIGLTELGSIDLENTQRIWSLSRKGGSTVHDVLCLSFLNETRLLSFSASDMDDGIEEIVLDNFQSDVATLLAVSCQDGTCVQVTSKSLRTTSGLDWRPPAGKTITVAASFSTGDVQQIAVGLAGGDVILLTLENSAIEETRSMTAPQEISCMTLFTVAGQQVLAIGLWAVQEVMLFDLTTFESLSTVAVPSAFLLRSLQAVTFSDDQTFLFIGLGDGTLYLYELGSSASEGKVHVKDETKKAVVLGNRPITLDTFESGGQQSLIVTSDKPTMVTRTHGRFNYAPIHANDVTSTCKFNSSAFGRSLAVASIDGIQFARIDSIQSLQIKTIQLGDDSPRRIAWHSKSKTYGILCTREQFDVSTGNQVRTSSFKIVDKDFNILEEHDFEEEEEGTAVAALDTWNGEPHFVVGCATLLPEEVMAKRGRVILYAAANGSVTVSQDVGGAPLALAELPDNRIAATVNAQLVIFGHSNDAGGLEQVATWGGTFLAVALATKQTSILVGDGLRSAVFLSIDDQNTLVEEAREFNAQGITSLQILSEKAFIAADIGMNLFTMHPADEPTGNSGTTTCHKLQQAGLYHLGDSVTRIKPGSLVPKFVQSASADRSRLIYATTRGAIGVILGLNSKDSELLSALQRNMRSVLPALGGLEHQEWRKFRDETRERESVGFIDGDFVEQWMDLDDAQVARILEGRSEAERILASKEEITTLLEDLVRLH